MPQPDMLEPREIEPLAATPRVDTATTPGGRGGAGPGRRAALGAAVVLAGGAALAVALWPRGPAPGDPEAARELGVSPQVTPATIAAPRPTLPCFVDGQLIGRLTLDDCASRHGVASGSLEVPTAARPTPTRGAVALVPIAAPPATARAVAPPLQHDVPRRPLAEPPWPAMRPTPEPQLASAEPVPRTAESADVERRPIAQVPPRRASALAVREFYSALGEGDGSRAAAVVIPEKREEGPLSAGELTRFYSSLRAPLRLTRVDPINDNTVFVRYQFVTPDDRLCSGSATVTTTHRDGDTLVRGIRTFNGC